MTTLILPPSETKRDGGAAGSCLDLTALSFPDLTDARRDVLDALASLLSDDEAAARALKLSARAADRELARDRAVRATPTMAAMDRYTGVLYDALGASVLSPSARARAHRHVLVHSALLGLVGAGDLLPAYRLSHDSRLPGLALKRHWSAANAAVLASLDGPILDLRSEGYAALGPLPERDDALFVRVVSIGEDGAARALNHFNKKGKGAFVRDLLEHGPLPETITDVIAAAGECGWPLRPGAPGELELVVPATLEGFAAAS
ncbi:peroxide stress protein YaaA [Microcella alkalica]|uniref:Peroxide stress protein YaaA n=1 Tax=Microcella alkalica TaxID=355930 RepID=A0A839E339_9MICO|nr:hypothetical protein [Microcella alkalica]